MDAVRAARIAQFTFHSSEESNHAPDVEQSNVDDASMSEFEQDASENEEASPLQHAHLDEYEVISEEADCSIVSDFSYPAETEEQMIAAIVAVFGAEHAIAQQNLEMQHAEELCVGNENNIETDLELARQLNADEQLASVPPSRHVHFLTDSQQKRLNDAAPTPDALPRPIRSTNYAFLIAVLAHPTTLVVASVLSLAGLMLLGSVIAGFLPPAIGLTLACIGLFSGVGLGYVQRTAANQMPAENVFAMPTLASLV